MKPKKKKAYKRKALGKTMEEISTGLLAGGPLHGLDVLFFREARRVAELKRRKS
jgi:hypothetical protein